MKPLGSREIREKFLGFFQNNDHLKINASSIVPHNDPTLLFINSGMAPLKKYFLGKETPPCPRLTNYQPCIRTKDVDDVGDRHHLTMFEMLGSWSIGDYYKEKAVELAYNLLVNELGFDKEKLYVTCYEGDKELGLPADEASAKAWEKMGIAKDHIIFLGIDNFWGPAGDSGPCGPCTEVFYDCGEKFGPEWKPGDEFDTTKRYIEIWNAGVFMEFNKSKEGSFSPLPLKSVDTGSGLERMEMIMNGYDSVYQTDLMRPILELVTSQFPKLDEKGRYMMTDHLRSSSMMLSEGISPGNEGQGYIPRRLLRKCLGAVVSAGYDNPDFSIFVNKVEELMGEYYPALKQNKDFILNQIQLEIDEFLPIVKKGITHINAVFNMSDSSSLFDIAENERISLPNKNKKMFSGRQAFILNTTHGLPLDVIYSELEKHNTVLNEKEYLKCQEEHKKISRVVNYGNSDSGVSLEDLFNETQPTIFSGYERMEDNSSVLCLVKGEQLVEQVQEGEEFFFAVAQTPFYAESGGQVGDKGTFKSSSFEGIIRDTQKAGDVFYHVAKLQKGTLKKGDNLNLVVNNETRLKIRRNHSATHLLHAALREVVGKHALQKGSQVTSERLRFDFQNNGPLTHEQLEKIEVLTNRWIRDNNDGTTRELAYSEALDEGALGLFGENYGDKVRVVNFGKESKELCGGTHVETTGEIGLMLIVSETSVAKGIRRIEAITGEKAVRYIQERNHVLREASRLLNSKVSSLPENIEKLQKKNTELKKQGKTSSSNSEISPVNEQMVEVKGLKFVLARVDSDKDNLKNYGDQRLDKGAEDIVALVGQDEGSVRAFVWVKQELSKKVRAGDLLKQILEPIGGKGGGKPHFAQGGGSAGADLTKVFELIDNGSLKNWLEQKL
ncbi:MAG: alanine--tRNA ligase [Bacteriovoracaceae bacterium]